MNIYKAIYNISKKKNQFFLIILIAGFLGINFDKLFEKKYFFETKIVLKVSLNETPAINLNQIISNLESDLTNQLYLKKNYINIKKSKNFYEFKIYLKKNDLIEFEKEYQELLKITNEYRKKFLNYLSYTKQLKEEELKNIQEFKKSNLEDSVDKTSTLRVINGIYEVKKDLIILEKIIESTNEFYPIEIFTDKEILENNNKINKYAITILMIIFSILMYVTFILISDEYKKEIKKIK